MSGLAWNPHTLATLSQAAGYIVLVAYLAWCWQMATHHRMLTGRGPRVGRVGAVVWWFVPVANLFMPAVFLAGVVAAYAIPGRNAHRWLVPVWWATFIGGFVVGIAWAVDLTNRLGDAGPLDPLPMMDPGLLLVTSLLSVVAALALIAIVLLVNRNAAIRYRAALQGWPPPPTG